jgi:hypothetical protein
MSYAAQEPFSLAGLGHGLPGSGGKPLAPSLG